MSAVEDNMVVGGWDLTPRALKARTLEAQQKKKVVGANLPDEAHHFASDSERKTNHMPLHHAGCFMAGVPLHLASTSVKYLTEHHANGDLGVDGIRWHQHPAPLAFKWGQC